MSNINHLNTPPDALGALYFLPGQYLFKRIENGRESAKALSSEQISRAFREFKTDTSWLSRRILRYREESEGNYILSFEPAGIRTIFTDHQEDFAMSLDLSFARAATRNCSKIRNYRKFEKIRNGFRVPNLSESANKV